MTNICAVISAAILALALAGCQTVSTPVYCELAQPLSWSKSDTRPTIRGIKGHNAVYKTNCK